MMKIIRDPTKLQKEMAALRWRGKTIGFVPTMGALHEGHLSLVRAARRENDVVVVSIFVNPLQFGPREDLKKYPRPVRKDLALLRKGKVDFVFLPSAEALYPENFSVVVDVGPHCHYGPPCHPRESGDPDSGFPIKAHAALPQCCSAACGNDTNARRIRHRFRQDLTNVLCGKFRPGHFRGVMTVVAKLFNIVRPDRAYFGAKDYQQAKIIEHLNRDLNYGIAIRILPTVREPDGLAMSSRNRYLNPEERRRALAISQILFWLRDQLVAVVSDPRRSCHPRGSGDPESGFPLKAHAALPQCCSAACGNDTNVKHVLAAPRQFNMLKREALTQLRSKVDRVDYLEVVDPETLVSLKKVQPKMVALTACFVGKTRLIDNVTINAQKSYKF